MPRLGAATGANSGSLRLKAEPSTAQSQGRGTWFTIPLNGANPYLGRLGFPNKKKPRAEARGFSLVTVVNFYLITSLAEDSNSGGMSSCMRLARAEFSIILPRLLVVIGMLDG